MDGRWGMIRMLGILFGVPAILAGLFSCGFGLISSARPRDQELIDLFHAHRTGFEELRSMAIEDAGKVSFLSADTLAKSPLSEARSRKYAQLMSEIRPGVVVRIDPIMISFSYSAGGSSLAIGRSWMKGIAYVPDGPHRLGQTVNSLDNLPENSDGIYLLPIEGHWYLIYSNLD
jgi:hypothetical protein